MEVQDMIDLARRARESAVRAAREEAYWLDLALKQLEQTERPCEVACG